MSMSQMAFEALQKTAPFLREIAERKERWANAGATNGNKWGSSNRLALETLLDNCVMDWASRHRGAAPGTVPVSEVMTEVRKELKEAASTSTVAGTFTGSSLLPIYIAATQRMWFGSILPHICDVQPIPNGGIDGRFFILASKIDYDISGNYPADTALRSALAKVVVRPSEGGTSTSIKPGITSDTITAVEHKLQSNLSALLRVGFQSQFNVQLSAYMVGEMANYLTAVKNYAALVDLKEALAAYDSGSHQGIWYTSPPDSDTQYVESRKSWQDTLFDSLTDMDTQIDVDWSRRSNTLVTDATGLSWLEKIESNKGMSNKAFQMDPGFASQLKDGTVNEFISNYAGLLYNKWRVFRVYQTPVVGEVYMASKGEAFKTGGIYAPSVEFQVASKLEPGNFVQTDGILSLCEWKFPIEECYAMVTPTAR